MNMLALLQKTKVNTNFINAESPITSHIFPPDQYIREEKHGHSLLKLKDETTGKSFFLEIKKCTCDWMHHIQWCNEIQLRKYLSYHKKTPTFLLLEVQNDDNKPHTYYLLSMTQACHVNLIDTSIMHCKIDTKEPVLSKHLWSR
jgi:hypothetical protein